MILVDTSVLVAASVAGHPRFSECVAVLDRFSGDLACSAHALAETYSTLSKYPLPARMRPSEVIEVLEDLIKVLKVVALTPVEYVRLLRDISALGIAGSAVYDALHVACARKVHAERIYTLNAKDFRRVAPDLGSVIVEP